MKNRPPRRRRKPAREEMTREERWRLIALAARARRIEKLVFGAVVLGVVAATVYYCVSRGIVRDYRALPLCVGIPMIIMFSLHDPVKMLFRWRFRSNQHESE